MRLLKYIFLLSVCLSKTILAQSYQMPEEFTFSFLTSKVLAVRQSTLHQGIQPYIPFFSKDYLHREDSTKVFKYISDDPLLDAVLKHQPVSVEDKKEGLKLNISPILQLDASTDLAASTYSRFTTNTRGAFANGTIGDKFYFETVFAENQATFPSYLATQVTTNSVVPGQGRWKQFKVSGYDYAWVGGVISMQPSKRMNIQLGHGKQKIGNGYRSLLLSDNALNYPFIRFTHQYWKGRVQYSHIFSQLSNLTPASLHRSLKIERLFQRKAAAFQYISINWTKWLNTSFFQGMVAQPGDSYNRQHIPLGFFNPLPLAGRLQFGLNDSRVNVMTGMDLLIKLSNQFQLYGQYMADFYDPSVISKSGIGFQCGMKYFNAFGWRPLTLQLEYNKANYGSYRNTKGLVGLNDYTHNNEALAYVAGPGKELIVIGNYSAHRLVAHLQYHYRVMAGPVKAAGDINLAQIRLGYVINPAYNLQVCGGYLYRKQNLFNFNPSVNETGWFYLSVRTSLYNTYYDF